jgi:hypothetical protein
MYVAGRCASLPQFGSPFDLNLTYTIYFEQPLLDVHIALSPIAAYYFLHHRGVATTIVVATKSVGTGPAVIREVATRQYIRAGVERERKVYYKKHYRN